MKSAEEWVAEMIEDRDQWEVDDWNFDPDGKGDACVKYAPDYAVKEYVAQLARAIQADAIKACAERTLWLVEDAENTFQSTLSRAGKHEEQKLVSKLMVALRLRLEQQMWRPEEEMPAELKD